MTFLARHHRCGPLAAGLSLLLAAVPAAAADAPPASAPAGQPPRLAMQAGGVFFDGRIEVQVSLAAGAGRRPDGAEKAAGEPPGAGGRPRGGRRGPPGGGPPPGGGGFAGPPGSDEGPASAQPGGRPRAAAGGRPLMLHLKVANRGDQAVSVEVADFNSALGNFVVLPARFRLEPGASAEAEPMTSRLGNAAAEVPVTVRLRLAGKAEQQVLTLKVVPPAAPVPGAAPPATAPAATGAQRPRS